MRYFPGDDGRTPLHQLKRERSVLLSVGAGPTLFDGNRGHEVTPFVESATSCSHVVNHGKHCGYHCEDLVSRMEQGEEDLHSEEWILDVVRYGDIFFSLNNRHLWVSLAVSERCQRDDAKNNKTKNWTGSLRTDFSPRYFLPYLRCRATGIEYHE